MSGTASNFGVIQGGRISSEQTVAKPYSDTRRSRRSSSGWRASTYTMSSMMESSWVMWSWNTSLDLTSSRMGFEWLTWLPTPERKACAESGRRVTLSKSMGTPVIPPHASLLVHEMWKHVYHTCIPVNDQSKRNSR